MKTSVVWQLVLQVALIALNAVFACAEIAVISMNDARLAKLAEDGNKRARKLAKLTSQPARFLATIQVAITLAGFLGSAFAADNFSEGLTKWLISLGVSMSAATLDTICVVFITLVLSFFTLVLGELVPKRLAMKNPERLALGLAGLISFISVIFKPIVAVLSASTNGLLRLFGVDPDSGGEEVTEEEIRMMIDVGNEKGAIDAEEKKMLQNVFEFDDIQAGDIATHRTLVDMLWEEDDDAEWERTIRETRHTYYPICAESADNITGILDERDYFRLADKSRASVMSSAVSEPYFVPETVKADALFADMKKRRNPFAVVLDEYGGVAGVVTMNDLIEEIMGDIGSEDDEPEWTAEPTGDGAWRMSGAVPLDVVSDKLNIQLPDDEFDTLGGLLFSTLNAVPPDGETFTCIVEGIEAHVTDICDHRIKSATVRAVKTDMDDNAEASSPAAM